eukprot:CAMPEP_0172186838 /NCGR_PEP_ID=MMETSP1050-20130122/20990_1 /TAXON_ID=233186 /ORGANISM="Cryptomonas curvata, Strain CCAP979/52" /LENGTH=48 /DNA_ID= /DNA_START= /DNA_END= /DNA_ORIENTATION=
MAREPLELRAHERRPRRAVAPEAREGPRQPRRAHRVDAVHLEDAVGEP